MPFGIVSYGSGLVSDFYVYGSDLSVHTGCTSIRVKVTQGSVVIATGVVAVVNDEFSLLLTPTADVKCGEILRLELRCENDNALIATDDYQLMCFDICPQVQILYLQDSTYCENGQKTVTIVFDVDPIGDVTVTDHTGTALYTSPTASGQMQVSGTYPPGTIVSFTIATNEPGDNCADVVSSGIFTSDCPILNQCPVAAWSSDIGDCQDDGTRQISVTLTMSNSSGFPFNADVLRDGVIVGQVSQTNLTLTDSFATSDTSASYSVNFGSGVGCASLLHDVSFTVCETDDPTDPVDPIDPSDPDKAKCSVCKSCSDLIQRVLEGKGRPQPIINFRIILCCILIVIFALLVALKMVTVFNCGGFPGVNANSTGGTIIEFLSKYIGIALILSLFLLFCNVCCAFCGLVLGLILGFLMLLIQFVASGFTLPLCTIQPIFWESGIFWLIVAVILAMGLRQACKAHP